jgi:hypothetical protein
MKKNIILGIVGLLLMAMPISLFKYAIKPSGMEEMSLLMDPNAAVVQSILQIVGTILLLYVAMRGSKTRIINLDDIGSFSITNAIALMKEQNASIVQVGAKFGGTPLFIAVFIHGEEKVLRTKGFIETIMKLDKDGDSPIVKESIDISRSYGVERFVSNKWIMIRGFDNRSDMLNFGRLMDNERFVEVISIPIEAKV